ncbi:MAG: aminotransferase class I/II-fold pyridoxal phosphate-dependent enzyme [Bacteroidota bacterium]|nr:aminotransferase class I/II-fold pyridoxal phosphate-dependent enzyme [Bacteroidota bacterium]
MIVEETETLTEQLITPEFEKSYSSPRVSPMAAGLIGSEILKIAADIRAMIAEGKKICNLTVGDFNSSYFPIPDYLKDEIEIALIKGETNYPPSDGVLILRKAVQEFYRKRLGLDYPIESFIITGGARPVIYGIYSSVVAPGDTVVYPVPSWNNNHYCNLIGAKAVPIASSAEDAFLPTRKKLEGKLTGVRLLSLCSPLNPTGTAFTKEALEGICDLVLEENAKRSPSERPLFLMYDQVYWMLTFGQTKHYNPVSLRPEMAKYTIFVDGISKAFASTGLRVGWAVAPPDVAASMSNILGHVGAWAPRPEQVATAHLLNNDGVVDAYHEKMHADVEERLNTLYKEISSLRESGYPIDAIPPMGAIYLTARFNFIGKTAPSGVKLATNEDIRKYLLAAADFAIVPFQAFDLREDTGWFRLSVGAVSMAEINSIAPKLKAAMDALK